MVFVILTFCLGIANFAFHKAVLESGHPLVGPIRRAVGGRGPRLTLALEFLILLAAMLLAANGFPALVWGYLIYSLANGFSAWLMLSGRL